MQKQLSFAVIGCGYWGPNLVRNLRGVKGCQVRVVCDKNVSRIQHMKELYPEVETTQDSESVFRRQDIDAVCIATPAGTHYELAKKALLSEKHTFVEKPLALSTDHCRELIELAEARGLVLMVGHTFLYSAPVRYLKGLLDSGDIGEVFYINCQRLNLGLFQRDMNVVWDLAPHDVSIVLYLLETFPVKVTCSGKSHIAPQIVDVASMSLDFPGKPFATIQNSWLDPNKTRLITVVGSKKMVVYDDTSPNEKIRIYDKRVEAPPYYDDYAQFHFSYHYGDVICPRLELVEPLKVECEHFVECIREGKKPLTDGGNGMQVVSVIEAAQKSLEAGGTAVVMEERTLVAQ